MTTPMSAEVNVLGRRFRPVVVALVVAMTALLLAGIFERGLLGGTPWGAIEAGTEIHNDGPLEALHAEVWRVVRQLQGPA